MKYLVAVITIIVLFFVLAIFPEPKSQNEYKTTTVSIGDAQVNAQIADTDALRTLGLSGRKGLEEGQAMLFVFPSADKHGFWMKDMNFSLDIVWVDGGKIIFIEKSVSPTTFPHIFWPPSPTQFVLELPAGFVDAHGLSVGDFFSTGL